MNKSAIVAIALGAVALSGCQMNQGTQRLLGQVGGGVVGGLIGSQLGSGTGRLIAVGFGTLAGAWIGGEIASYLSESDQESAADAFQQAAVSGETISWNNPETSVSGTARVTDTSVDTARVEVPVLKDRVAAVPPLDMIGEDYTASSASNIRGGPGTDYVVVGSVQADQTVEVIGRVRDSNWVLVAQDGIGSGFVREDLLRPAPAQTAEQQAEVVRVRQSRQQEAIDRGEAQAVAVEAGQECRTVEQEINLEDGTTRTESIKACRGPNGWQVV